MVIHRVIVLVVAYHAFSALVCWFQLIFNPDNFVCDGHKDSALQGYFCEGTQHRDEYDIKEIQKYEHIWVQTHPRVKTESIQCQLKYNPSYKLLDGLLGASISEHREGRKNTNIQVNMKERHQNC